jgi:hypothetical protein
MVKDIESPCLIVLSCVEIINAFQCGFPPRTAHGRKTTIFSRGGASVIKSGFIRASVHHFTSSTLRRFHRRRLLHATDFFQAAGFTVRCG